MNFLREAGGDALATASLKDCAEVIVAQRDMYRKAFSERPPLKNPRDAEGILSAALLRESAASWTANQEILRTIKTQWEKALETAAQARFTPKELPAFHLNCEELKGALDLMNRLLDLMKEHSIHITANKGFFLDVYDSEHVLVFEVTDNSRAGLLERFVHWLDEEPAEVP